MTNDPIQNSGPREPSRPIGPGGDIGATRSASNTETDRNGPAFEALLEKLEARALDLKRTTEEVAGPTELSGAVDRARASLDDALSLGDQLLEAYRQATQNQKE